MTKPDPTLRINMGGSFTNLRVANTPGRAVGMTPFLSFAFALLIYFPRAIGGSSLTVSKITVDNCACLSMAYTNTRLKGCRCSAAGAQPNSKSDGKPAGHNTDGFDVSANDVTIENSSIVNQGTETRFKPFFSDTESTLHGV